MPNSDPDRAATAKRILVADPIHEQGRAFLAARPGLTVDVVTGLDEGALCQRIGDYDALIVRSKTRVTAPVIAAGTRLKVDRAGRHWRRQHRCRGGDGARNRRFQHARCERDDDGRARACASVVPEPPPSAGRPLGPSRRVETRRLRRHRACRKDGGRHRLWNDRAHRRAPLLGVPHARAGIRPLRRCGSRSAKQVPSRPIWIRCWRSSDYVTLHCPLNDATRNLLDASRFAKMKRGARIINCARGGLVDETALVEALASGHLAGAALDVYAKEPPANLAAPGTRQRGANAPRRRLDQRGAAGRERQDRRARRGIPRNRRGAKRGEPPAHCGRSGHPRATLSAACSGLGATVVGARARAHC